MAGSTITAEVVQKVTGRTVPQEALNASLALIQEWCGWKVVLDSYDVELDSDGSRLLVLPAMQIQSVDELSTIGRTPDDLATIDPGRYRWSRAGLVEAVGSRWPCGFRTVRAQFTAGYQELPGPFVTSVIALAQRLQLGAGVTQTQTLESVGGVSTNASVSYGGMSGFMLNDMDMAVLAPYRLRAQP